MNRIKTLIVDDEPLARERIRNLLPGFKEIYICGEAVSGADAVDKIQSLEPDIVFLDVQMPEFDGFEVLKKLTAVKIPVIIFVTAYDQFALKAFEVHALDYLLKPFDRERFNSALERAIDTIKNKKILMQDERIISLLNEIKPDTYIERIVVRSTGRIQFVRTVEINLIEADGNYLKLRLNKESHLVRESMNELQQKLDPKVFFRIHRSYIININFIKEIKPWFKGEYKIVMLNGAEVNSSKAYRENLRLILHDG